MTNNPKDQGYQDKFVTQIYLDNAATTRPAPEVCDAVLAAMRDAYGNPSSLHGKGLEAERAVGEARARVARVFSVDAARVFFTSGGTEANNAAIAGVCARGPRGRVNKIITTAAEHPSALAPIREFAGRGWTVEYCAIDACGAVDLNRLEMMLDDGVALISLAHVNNETGAIQPLADIARIRDVKCPRALLHADLVQSYGKLPFCPESAGVDLASVSAHKIHGPKGVGALYVSTRAKLQPLLYGGGQESGLRSGTENTPGIAGFGAAAALAFERMEQNATCPEKNIAKTAACSREHATSDMFYADGLGRALERGIREAGVEFLNIPDGGSRSPFILAVSFPAVPAELTLNSLSRDGVFVSSGAACSSKRRTKTGSHVLNAMGLKQPVIDGAIRFSFSRYNTLDEIAVAAAATAAAVKELSKHT